MAKITRTITINAPTKKVFDYMSDPNNLPEVWPSLVDVKNIKETPDHVGSSYQWTYKMAGLRFEGSTDCIESIDNQRRVDKTKGGISSTFTWAYQPENSKTLVDLGVEYNIPVPVLGKLAEAIIVKLNEHEADVLLENLKARMET
jgi:uncharacterized membrane protein